MRAATATGGDLAGLLIALADTLIPGEGGRWPPASQVGVHGVLAARLVEMRGPGAIDALAEALRRCGGPLEDQDAAGRTTILARLEAAEPALFALVRNAACLAYYESPVVIRIIQALGHVYDPMPHDTGYPLPPFDMERDRPRHARGRWIATADVRRVDLSGLPFLAARRSDHG